MAEVKIKFPGIGIEEINVEQDDEKLSEPYGVMSIPTLIFLKDDKVVDRIVGLSTENKIIDIINKHL